MNAVDPQRQRVRNLALIKGVLAAVILAIMIVTFPYPLPLSVAVLDLLTVGFYLWAGQRWPAAATYLLIAETALALTPRQFVQGYVNGINWVFYIPLPLAAAYVIRTRQSLIRAGVIVLCIALPVMLLAALTLEPRVGRVEILTLVAYIAVVLIGVLWLNIGLTD